MLADQIVKVFRCRVTTTYVKPLLTGRFLCADVMALTFNHDKAGEVFPSLPDGGNHPIYLKGVLSELFFFARALTENPGTATIAANQILANTVAQLGIQDQGDSVYADVSILTGNDPGNGQADATSFAAGTYTAQFDLSTLSFSADEGALAGAANIADIDLFLFAFQQNVSDITTAGITVDNFSVTAVPEPSSLLMSCFGLLGLYLYRKR